MSKKAERANMLDEARREKAKLALVRSVLGAKEEKGVHGNALEVQDPQKAIRILGMMADGCTLRQITRDTGVYFNELVALRGRHCDSLDRRKEQVANDALDLMEAARLLQREKMTQLAEDPEALAKVNLRDLAMSYGLYGDKYIQATEGNRVVIEHKSGAPSIDDAIKAIAEAREKLRGVSVEVVVEEVSLTTPSHE